MRIPGVYVMDGERGINAFAAGWDVSGAVVAVTRGTLEALNRDELQGVIGHEFSHIVNGDMRLNVSMIGVLAGIVFIGSIGLYIMRKAGNADDWRDAIGTFVVGLVVFLIGYMGLFFARLIKAAVSRQREFLADASSVQFTRNPDGIAGALDQIKAAPSGALISGRYAEEVSHMFFGQGIRVWLGGAFDTHPPLDERIRRVHPGFQPSAYRSKRPTTALPAGTPGEESFGHAAASGFAAAALPAGRRAGDLGSAWGRSAGESAGLVGTLQSGKIDYAARLLASLPVPLRESLREFEGARAAIIALLLAPRDEVMQQQIEALNAAGLAGLAQRAREASLHMRTLGPAFRLPVIDLALPAVKAAPESSKEGLIAGMAAVIHADRRVSLRQFVVLTMVRDQLAPKSKPGAAAIKKLSELQAEAATVLGLIAHAGTRADSTDERKAELQAALRAGAKEMAIPEQLAFDRSAPGALTLDAAAAALESLKQLAPLQKALLVRGLFATAIADGTFRVAEAELMRLTGAVLNCPLPPQLAEIDPASLAA